MLDKQAKNQRILSIYARLCEGRTIRKSDEAEFFGVDTRSIQRDIDDIRAFLGDRQASDGTDDRKVIYDRVKKGFVLTGSEYNGLINLDTFSDRL